MTPMVTTFFDQRTFTATHVVACGGTGQCAIVDPVLDYDPASGRTASGSADRVIAEIAGRGLTVAAILETHVHADHLSAAPYLKSRLGGQIVIGAQIVAVQATFARLFNIGPSFKADGSQFDRLVSDGDTLAIGDMTVRVMHTPGHTPACVTYVVGDAAFVGDTLFMPDYGTARCDFPGGDARTLYRSIRRILTLPEATRLFLCHDYLSGERKAHCWATTVAEERRANVHIRDGVAEDAFVSMRQARDAGLAMPALLLPSVQVNMRAGQLPPAEANGVSYLKIPVNAV